MTQVKTAAMIALENSKKVTAYAKEVSLNAQIQCLETMLKVRKM